MILAQTKISAAVTGIVPSYLSVSVLTSVFFPSHRFPETSLNYKSTCYLAVVHCALSAALFMKIRVAFLLFDLVPDPRALAHPLSP